MSFSSTIDYHPPAAHLSVSGDLDASSVTLVRRNIADALAGGLTRFTIDTAGVTFMDAVGVSAFVRLHNALRSCDGSLTFVSVSAPFQRVCTVAGLGTPFGLEVPTA